MSNESVKYNHKEAFCLMRYGCQDCNHRELIWNSRDGVTPFGTTCPSCGNLNFVHMDWHWDKLTPNYKLNPYQKFWREGTQEEAVALITAQYNDYLKHNPIENISQRLAIAIQNIKDGKSLDYRPGWPVLDINLPEWMAKK